MCCCHYKRQRERERREENEKKRYHARASLGCRSAIHNWRGGVRRMQDGQKTGAHNRNTGEISCVLLTCSTLQRTLRQPDSRQTFYQCTRCSCACFHSRSAFCYSNNKSKTWRFCTQRVITHWLCSALGVLSVVTFTHLVRFTSYCAAAAAAVE